MKTFIFIIYVLFIIIIPQIYTAIARDIADDEDTKTIYILIGGMICCALIFGFTMLLVDWNIISITL